MKTEDRYEVMREGNEHMETMLPTIELPNERYPVIATKT